MTVLNVELEVANKEEALKIIQSIGKKLKVNKALLVDDLLNESVSSPPISDPVSAQSTPSSAQPQKTQTQAQVQAQVPKQTEIVSSPSSLSEDEPTMGSGSKVFDGKRAKDLKPSEIAKFENGAEYLEFCLTTIHNALQTELTQEKIAKFKNLQAWVNKALNRPS